MTTPTTFTTITIEGGLLSADLLATLATPTPDLPGTGPEDYHLPQSGRLRDAIARSWTELQGHWSAFAQELDRVERGPGAGMTRERWLLPLFRELGFGWLQRSTQAQAIEGRSYPISHVWGHVPIHLLGADVDLDRRSERVAGAATAAPFSMLQELLNRSDAHLWGLLSNGRRLRLMRDTASLARASYIEFDLEAMFAGQVFADFVVLWLLCHQSRFDAETPDQCWLETWLKESTARGVRALDQLRNGFVGAIETLGQGFLAHRANTELRAALRDGTLPVEDYQRELLRLVYRLVFLLVAEDRDLLHPPAATERARELYRRYYSVERLRRLARQHRGTPHGDLYSSLLPVFDALRAEGSSELGLPMLGSFLWSVEACPHLEAAQLSNAALLEAIRHLGYTEANRSLRRVDFANLGSEELGGVYESLLELHPKVSLTEARFDLLSAPGSERKSTGSYYTPTPLIAVLLDTALDPLIERAAHESDPRASLLSLKVLDPACGSGHFLTAAARRIAARIASIDTKESSPPPSAIRHALREVVGRCIYGIDVNPMALELAKINLWLEAMEPGRPLQFLDHHLVCGDALLGTTPRLLAAGIPKNAFKPCEGDDTRTASSQAKSNARERPDQAPLALGDPVLTALAAVRREAIAIDLEDDTTPAALRAKEHHWRALQETPEARRARLAADTWCAAFFAPKRPGSPPITQTVLKALEQGYSPSNQAIALVEELANRYRFLHLHLAFPDVFAPDPTGEHGWQGGFDLVLGNPPWEKVRLDEQEFFASRDPEIANAAGADRKRRIARLQEEDPAVWHAFREASEHAARVSHFLHHSGRYPLCGQGDVNTYAVFAEAMRGACAPNGFVAAIVPTGIVTDHTTRHFLQTVTAGELVAFYDFENRAKLFPEVHRSFKFSLLVLARQQDPTRRAELAFFCHRVEDLRDPTRRIALTSDELALLNPNTRTMPIFRSRRDAELTVGIYQRIPILVREGHEDGNPWGISFKTLFHMTNDSALFRGHDDLAGDGYVLEGNVLCRGQERYLPLYEAKMVHQFDHRWASYERGKIHELSDAEKADPTTCALPRYWVPADEVEQRLAGWPHRWMLGFRDIARSTDVRTVIATALPAHGAGNKLPLLISPAAPREIALLGASLSSLALDYVARQKVGGTNLNFFIVKQLPVLPTEIYAQPAPWDERVTLTEWLTPRILELTYTAWELRDFARDLGYEGPPFAFDEERRAALRAELDACFFRLYGLERDDVDHVLGTFPVLERSERARFGEFRTRRLVLERYDAMTEAIRTGTCYQAMDGDTQESAAP